MSNGDHRGTFRASDIRPAHPSGLAHIVEYADNVAHLPPLERALLRSLSRFANASGDAWPSQERLASLVGVSTSTVRRGMQNLAALQIIYLSKREPAEGEGPNQLHYHFDGADCN